MRVTYLAPLAALLLAAPADAAPLSVTLGQTKVLNVPGRIASLSVDAPEVLAVKKLPSGGISMKGKSTGKSQVVIRTADGDEHTFTVYVITGSMYQGRSDGAAAPPRADKPAPRAEPKTKAKSAESARKAKREEVWRAMGNIDEAVARWQE